MLDLEIPLSRKKLSVDRFTDEDAQRIEDRLRTMNGQLKDAIAAVLALHRTNLDDVRGLREMFAQMSIHAGQVLDGELTLQLRKVPRNVTFFDQQITRGQEELITEIIRDVVFLPEGAEDPDRRQEVMKEMCRRAGIFRPGERVRTFIWGGHSVPQAEKDFAERVGYWDGLSGNEIITGCGPGIMKTPFDGALIGYQKMRLGFHRPDLIGFTEPGILAFETPNDRINKLVVFPNMEMRMEAFIRASHRGRVHPGGSGTMEEIMTFLGMKLHPDNEGMRYPFDLVERPDGEYMKMLHRFFRECFGYALDGLLNIRVESAKDYGHYVHETNRGLPTDRLWNSDLVMPAEIGQPFEVNFDSIESIDLSLDQEPYHLIKNLRWFFTSMVYLIAKHPEKVEEWGTDRPKVKGDSRVVQAVDSLIREFNQLNRLRMSGEIEDLPYRID